MESCSWGEVNGKVKKQAVESHMYYKSFLCILTRQAALGFQPYNCLYSSDSSQRTNMAFGCKNNQVHNIKDHKPIQWRMMHCILGDICWTFSNQTEKQYVYMQGICDKPDISSAYQLRQESSADLFSASSWLSVLASLLGVLGSI